MKVAAVLIALSACLYIMYDTNMLKTLLHIATSDELYRVTLEVSF